VRVTGADPDLVAAIVDDFFPTAIEPLDDEVRVFFTTARDRDAAQHALAARFDVAPIEISDEDWARRSQENMLPVTVGRITICPSAVSATAGRPTATNPESPIPNPLTLVIQPSMGFGTGHHVTTRLCLEALQTLDLAGCDMLDVGTGSGVLAIAASMLGAAHAIGIDVDADALSSAHDNLALNPSARGVTFAEVDVARAPLPDSDLVAANLTGALLVRSSERIAAAVRPGGALILSGVLAHERDDVCGAFADMPVAWEREDEGWAGLIVKKVKRT
jgi:ribosomal protein L11 methyltransferase